MFLALFSLDLALDFLEQLAHTPFIGWLENFGF